MHQSVQDFVHRALEVADVEGKSVLEVGSADVNGSVRPYIESLNPSNYIGIDTAAGPGVDLIIDAARLTEHRYLGKWDIVLSTEMLEHVRDWRSCMWEMAKALAPGGLLLITTRSPGFVYHPYPEDHWRYTLSDMAAILEALDIEAIAIENDPQEDHPGVFVLARKPSAQWDPHPEDLDSITLAHVILTPAETHKPLPKTPSSRTLILFAHHDPEHLVDPYVVRYLEALGELGSIVFVSDSSPLDPESTKQILPLCDGVFARSGPSLDFGSWHLAWNLVRRRWSLHDFDRLVLVNDSVFAPLFPLQDMWETFTGADIYGAIESVELDRHLQSFFLVFDLNERTRPFLNDFWGYFQQVNDKSEVVILYEIGISRQALQAGLSLKPYVSAVDATQVCAGKPGYPLLGPRANRTLHNWDTLIKQFGFPFLKASIGRRPPDNLEEFIKAHTDYDYELIRANAKRPGYLVGGISYPQGVASTMSEPSAAKRQEPPVVSCGDFVVNKDTGCYIPI